MVFLLTEEGGVTEGLDSDAGGDGPAEEGEEVDGAVHLEPVVVESLGVTAGRGGDEVGYKGNDSAPRFDLTTGAVVVDLSLVFLVTQSAQPFCLLLSRMGYLPRGRGKRKTLAGGCGHTGRGTHAATVFTARQATRERTTALGMATDLPWMPAEDTPQSHRGRQGEGGNRGHRSAPVLYFLDGSRLAHTA